MEVKGKVIVVTGGGQGLGRSMAVEFAKKGAHLALVDLNQEQLDQTIALCEAEGVKAKSFICNVADEAQVEQTFSDIPKAMGSMDALINNAGILRDGLLIKAKEGVITKMPLQQWQSVIDVNLTGVFLCGREFAANCVESKTKGVIINISSIARAGNMGQTNYSAAKAGVVAMTVTWSKELARFGIRSAAIAPGMIETDMTKGMKPEALERMVSFVPVGRMGQPEEIAHSALYILENEYFSGRVIEMDGAMRL